MHDVKLFSSTVSMWLTADEALYQSSELDPSKQSKYASVMTGTMINIANDLPEGVVINFGSGNKEFGGSIGEKRKKEATTSHGSGEAQDVDDDDNRRQQQPKKKIKREDKRSIY